MKREQALSPVFSNLAKAAEKQQLIEESALFMQLSEQMTLKVPEKGTLGKIKECIAKDLDESYQAIGIAGNAAGDRGALRAMTWGEKVTKIQKSVISRYESKGEALLEGNDVFICEACGYIAISPAVPERCPICKAPASRFSVVN